MILFVTEYETQTRFGGTRRHRIAVASQPSQGFRIVGAWAIGRTLRPEDLRHDVSDRLSDDVIAELEKEAEDRWRIR